MTKRHDDFLREAIEVAREGLKSGNPPFGSIVVVDGVIREKAFNTTRTENNSLAHGEINLLLKIRGALTSDEISRATMYASNEPCPMCCGAIYWSGIRRVVYGSSRDALTKFRCFGLNVACREIFERGTDSVSVIGPMLENEVMPLYQHFYSKGGT